MNRGVLQSSPVQQMVTGNPNWWNSMRPPPPPLPLPPAHHQQMINPPFLPSNSSFFPYASSSPYELPADHTWSQLLMGGLVGEEEEESRGSQFEAKKLVNWEEEEQVLHQLASSTSHELVDVKQELNYLLQYAHANPTNWSSSNSPKSSCTSTVTSNNMLDFSSKMSDNINGKRNPPPDRSSSECNSPATTGVNKKARVQSSSGQSTIKVRKEKLGDRITALHQLVSPFGKTDTASVLLEAIGYIRFLQSQIEALSLPYLATAASSANCSRQRQQHNAPVERNSLFHEDLCQESQEELKKDLRSRGLCLVPVSCTLQVGSDNGADFWAPAIGGGFQ